MRHARREKILVECVCVCGMGRNLTSTTHTQSRHKVRIYFSICVQNHGRWRYYNRRYPFSTQRREAFARRQNFVVVVVAIIQSSPTLNSRIKKLLFCIIKRDEREKTLILIYVSRCCLKKICIRLNDYDFSTYG